MLDVNIWSKVHENDTQYDLPTENIMTIAYFL
jgi:hypothetical protein